MCKVIMVKQVRKRTCSILIFYLYFIFSNLYLVFDVHVLLYVFPNERN